jgi:hypothetical protein
MEVSVQVPSSSAATKAEDDAVPEDEADDAVEGDVGESEQALATAVMTRIRMKEIG